MSAVVEASLAELEQVIPDLSDLAAKGTTNYAPA
jgi:hypothetical protein